MERYILIQEKTLNANNKKSENNNILIDKYLNDLSVKLKNPNSILSKKIDKIADKGFYNLIILKKPSFFCFSPYKRKLYKELSKYFKNSGYIKIDNQANYFRLRFSNDNQHNIIISWKPNSVY